MKINIVIAIFALILLSTTPVSAHPESGHLPDSLAETEYLIAVDLDPKNTYMRNRLGVVLLNQSKMRGALKQFNAVLKLEPDDFDAHDGIGLVMLRQGKYIDAVRWFQKAVVLNDKDPKVHFHLGQAYIELGDSAKAIQEYRKSLSLVEDHEVRNEMLRLEQLLEEKR